LVANQLVGSPIFNSGVLYYDFYCSGTGLQVKDKLSRDWWTFMYLGWGYWIPVVLAIQNYTEPGTTWHFLSWDVASVTWFGIWSYCLTYDIVPKPRDPKNTLKSIPV
jgi:hypothetical protein